MSHMPRKHPSFPDLLAPQEDEGSAIRNREAESRTMRASSPSLDAAPVSKRSPSSSRPAENSLDARLERKMRIASELVRNLPVSDSRVRLLYVAIMRRDETLLDGVLAELNKP
jgi:hypothetical protein